RGGFRSGELVDLRHVADAHHPDIDDLDRVVGEVVAVFALVRLVKARPDIVELLLPEGAGGNLNLELVALPDVAQIAVADERHAFSFEMIGGKLFAQVRFHRGDV